MHGTCCVCAVLLVGLVAADPLLFVPHKEIAKEIEDQKVKVPDGSGIKIFDPNGDSDKRDSLNFDLKEKVPDGNGIKIFDPNGDSDKRDSLDFDLKEKIPDGSGIRIFDPNGDSAQHDSVKVEAEEVVCPDRKAACPNGNTCCQIGNNTDACCPMPLAVCCQDKKHCCPMRTKCDILKGMCIQDNIMVSWTENTPARLLPEPRHQNKETPASNSSLGSGSVMCPDGESECPDGNTCCKTSGGHYGCCKLENAVCCSDGVHCCPSGSTCDLTHGRCVHQKLDMTHEDIIVVSKVATEPMNHVQDIQCDSTHSCQNDNTCCKTAGGWGCCPLKNADCCSDGEHCCPHGTTCVVGQGKCVSAEASIDWFTKQVARKLPTALVKQGQRIKCDDTHSCESGQTCCKGPSGEWGCCPEPKAVCCSDHIHCCPEGMTCDVSAGKCIKETTVDLLTKHDPIQRKNEVTKVKCDESFSCDSGETCCKGPGGEWGCCPKPEAVCCSDRIHCCPKGTTCDLSNGTCKGETTVDLLTKHEPLQHQKDVQCDSTYSCSDGDTCCKGPTGNWACCPSPNAVCCGDGVHCCPENMTCDLTHGKCTYGDITLPWFKKQASTFKEAKVMCDGTHACEDGSTCCKQKSGEWGCCPLKEAVCCSDGEHCCPKGYTCQVSAGTCAKEDEVIDWVQKHQAIRKVWPVGHVDSIVCPGGHFKCPDGSTCCNSSIGQVGCCPVPNAVCCSDGFHCCPHGYTCDVSSGTCNKGTEVMDWVNKQPALPRTTDILKNVVCPGGQFQCPDNNTCCKLSSGQYGCCPAPNAVCCSDHISCCPHGYTCDVSAGTCSKGVEVLDWVNKQPALPRNSDIAKSVVCPGGQFECPDGDTCCQLSSGQYGCCPVPNAVCCSDGVHCCPHGYTCDVSAGTCNKGELIDWANIQPALLRTTDIVKNVVCPESQTQCPSGNTCCKLSSGQYGCCPIPNAVCCSDDIHCCPQGTTCDVSGGTCHRGEEVIAWMDKQPALPREMKSVVCPGGQFECPDGDTCCPLSSGQYGCCPIPNAVCCSDGVHCCPHGYTCDVSAGTCNKGDEMIDWAKKQPALLRTTDIVKNVVCPESQTQCPSGNTCCKLSSGQYGCCPIPNAVCCSDDIHCCPQGTTCDVSGGTCHRGEEVIAWMDKQPALPREMKSVVCPGGHFECPSGDTCCQLSSGQYGCCPFPNAVCCSDGVHCCPHGYTCDVSAGTCNKGAEVIDWLKKQPALLRDVKSVLCPGGQFECPDGQTCCQAGAEQWGCCPLSQAVCCSDHIHCCPHDTTCDVSAGRCNRGEAVIGVIAWMDKQPALPREMKSVVCPGGQFECPDGNTCCRLSSGQYGCCPIPNAVCCSDGVHCCPHGYTCDVSSGICSTGAEVLDWVIKQPAMQRISDIVKSVVCPQGQFQCPDGDTCCKLSSGQYGCCPIPNAVCCSDGVNCCPHDYTCDVSAGTCNCAEFLDWATTKPAMSKTVALLSNVICPGGEYECPSGSTCCKTIAGLWACCPVAQAVCCSDHVHCCPQGYTCEATTGSCMKDAEVIDWLNKQSAVPRTTDIVKDVVCPGGQFQCPDKNTCCHVSSGQYGCCPITNAVCCVDGVHCCPHSYTCDVSAGTCTKGVEVIDWLNKQPAMPRGDEGLDWVNKQPALPITTDIVKNVTCPGGQQTCPDGQTCCEMSSGVYGCCPVPNAVCCSDKIHCCPQDYTCNVFAGTCSKGVEVVDWFNKQPAMPKAADKLGNVICPRGTVQCSGKQTCCKTNSGQYGCCPFPNAVCCNDGVHCCPKGYTCDVSAGTCSIEVKISSKWFLHKRVLSRNVLNLNNVICPDKEHQCPSGDTCCKLASGEWGCCPKPNAVCCSDGIHCCPHGYTCDVTAGTCKQGDKVISWLKKGKAESLLKEITASNNVVCPDKQHQCPSGDTCCKLASGQWGCCPEPNAVCCSDGIHCCPHDYTCDVTAGTCKQGDKVMLWLEKGNAESLLREVTAVGVKDVICPDRSSKCQDNQTCCQMSSGAWGCCNLPNAVCCSDGVHCCPHGTTCDTVAERCRSSSGVGLIDWVEKVPAMVNRLAGVMCPDGSECQYGQTCCEMKCDGDECEKYGKYGCCPLPDAVCCSDEEHCCPSGTKCDMTKQRCEIGHHIHFPVFKLAVPWKPPPHKTTVAMETSLAVVKCPDGATECPDQNTCCMNTEGKYNCCLYPEAVCCASKIGCCPKGYICDEQPNICRIPDRGQLSAIFLDRIRPRKTLPPQ